MTRFFFLFFSSIVLLAIILFSKSPYVYAEKQFDRCLLESSPRELNENELKEILKCDGFLLIFENKLKIEDQAFLLGKAIEGYPNNGDLKDLVSGILLANIKNVKIIDFFKFSTAIRPGDPEPLLPLSEMYIERFLNQEELEKLPHILSELLNQKQVEVLFSSLLESNISNVKIGASRIIFSDLDNEFFNNFDQNKALTMLNKNAEEGNFDAFSELIFFRDKDIKDSRFEDYNRKLVDLMRNFSIDRFSTFDADRFLNRVFLSLPSGTLTNAEIRKLFKIAIEDNHTKVFLGRFFWELGLIEEKPSFDLSYLTENEKTDFMQCLTKLNISLSDCFKLYKKNNDTDRFLLSELFYFKQLAVAFDISNTEKISNKLLKIIFNEDIELEIKNDVTGYIFPSFRIYHQGVNKGVIKDLNKIYDIICWHVWDKYALEIATNKGIDHFEMFPSSLYSRGNVMDIFFKKNSDYFYRSSSIEKALLVVDKATSHTFFEQLGFPLYYTFANTQVNIFENTIDNILKRYTELYGRKTETYFSFEHLKSLAVESTQSEDPIARYLSFINKMEALGLDASLNRQQLLEYLVDAGSYKKALPLAKDAFYHAKEKLKEKELNDKSIDSINYGIACGLAMTLSKVERKLKLKDRQIYLKHCFNNFNWPAEADISFQSDAMSDLVVREFVGSTNLASSDKTKTSLKTFVLKTLENNLASNPLLAPFVIMNMMLETNEVERKKIRDKYFNKQTFENNSVLIDESLWKIEYYNVLANYLVDQDADDKFLLSTLDFIIRSLEPSLSSPISNIVAEKKSEDFQREGLFQLISTDKETKPVLKRLYRMHNLLKFGPNEQLVMRSEALSGAQREKYNALLNQKDILIEKVFHSEKNTAMNETDFKKLEMIDNKLEGFSFSTPDWNEVFLTVDQLEIVLQENVQLFDFRHNKVQNEIELFSFVKGRSQRISIKNAEKIRESTELFRNKVINIDPTYYIEAKYLFETLIKPYLNQSSKKILISPHSFLYNIPFDALVVEHDKKNTNTATSSNIIKKRGLATGEIGKNFTTNVIHFGQKFEVSLLTGIRNLKEPNKYEKYNFVGIGDPIFKGEIKAKQVSFNSLSISPKLNRGSVDSLVRLPGTKLELETISKSNLFDSTTLYMDKNATEEAINSSVPIKEAAVISFATHGMVSGELDQYSQPGLALTPIDPSIKERDGFFSLNDVLNLSLKAELVILSACETGASRSSFSPPFSGLASAFLASGAEKVLVSLWQVDDEATRRFMEELVSSREKSETWTSAKKIAVNSFISKFKKFSHPYYWSSFVTFGSSI